LAREAKKGVEERRQMRFDNADRRKAREEAARRIEEHGDKATGAKIERYLLWQEQGEECVYSGRKISVVQLLSDAVSVDHILPRWRSLDDSRANKVVVFREENEQKGDQTPREWLETRDPAKYEAVLQRAERLPGNKRRKFIQQGIVLDDFVNRQLTDTAYISRLTTQYLRRLGVPIVTPRGQMTAELRHFWGLNNILDPEGRGQKNRADHRHHAVDALVIALTDAKRLHALANDRGRNVTPPWEGLFEDARRTIQGINVSHRVVRRLHGALHEATFYGATQKRPSDATAPGSTQRPWAKDWIEGDQVFVRRKDVTDLTDTKHIEKIRDGTIRELLREHVRRAGIDPDKPAKIPGDVFKGPNTPRMASGVPIRKVRMIEESATFRPVSARRSYQNVKPGSNHHIVYRAVGAGESERWTAEVVTMWDAARRARNRKPIVERCDSEAERFVMSLSLNDSFLITDASGQQKLCIVREIDQRSKRIKYRSHADARPEKEVRLLKARLLATPERMREMTARKVLVDSLGRIRWAQD
jgi:CRISPR-associated endonuclease Csn1